MNTTTAASSRISRGDVFALGFMTFALFLGAGNIIFPAESGLAAGSTVWQAALGFLITGVGLPLLTVVFGDWPFLCYATYGCCFL